MDPDLGLHCISKRLQKLFNRQQKQTTCIVFGVFCVKTENFNTFLFFAVTWS